MAKKVEVGYVNHGPIAESKRLKTVLIRSKFDGRKIRVNTADFGSDRFPSRDYAIVDESVLEIEQEIEQSKKELHDSLYTPSDLETMSIQELRKLPEYSRIQDGKKIKDKGKLIEAILAERSVAREV